MLAKFRILMIALFALVAVPETIFADDTAKISALEELLKQYMDENAELKKVIAEQGANEPEADGDVVVDEANAPAESADATVRLELYSSEVICKRSKLNANEIGLVAKMDAQKFADEAKRRGLVCADKVVDDVNTPSDGADETVRLELYSSEIICERAHLNDKEYGLVVKMDAQKYADEAKRRGLDCSQAATQTCKLSPENCDETELCKMATYGSSVKVWYSGSGQVYVDAAQARGLDCGVEKTAYIPTPVKTCEEDPKNCKADELCKKATYGSSVKVWYSGSGQVYVDAAQARGLDCGVESAATSTNASYTCENNPASCNVQRLCQNATTRTGSSVSWSMDPSSRPYVDEARKRQLACSLTFPLASCKGWNGTINVMDGLNSTKATMTGHVLAKDLREYCTRDPGGETTNYGGKLSIDQCVAKYLAQKNDPLRTTANCETGDLVFERYLNGEKKVSKQTFPLGIGTETSCASGLMPLEAQFAMLCPKNANSDDWIAAGQQRKADAEKQKADAQAAEQKRLADEKQKKADADAQAAEQKQLADEEQIKADADAQAAEQKRLADDNAQSDAEYEKGASLYYDKDYQAAFDILMPLAEQGNPKAQNTIGMMYFLGYGVSQDDVAAEKWIKLAAEQGYLEAQSNLGDFYLYAEPLNSSEVLKWYRLAAEQGDGWSQMTLGLLFNKGKPGIPIDYEIAYAWLFLAQKNGESVQQMIDEVQSKMTPDAVNNAKRRVADCYDSSYKNCGWNEVSQKIEIEASVYAELERGASEFRNDNAQAGLKIVIPLAEGGDANSQAFLGILYLEGHTQYDGMGVPVDFVKAFKWLKLAASQGQPDAQLNLGEMYQFGNGVPQNKLRATMWYALAEENGSSYARKSLFDIQWSMEDWETAMIKTMIDNCKNSQYKDCGW